MPTKRRTPKTRDHPITPEAVAAYRAGDALALHRALNLKPWTASPLDAGGACPWSPGSGGAETWQLAVDLRAELEAASCQ
jgi:hypothetical protein